MSRATASGRRSAKRGPVLLAATRKGAWLFHADTGRRTWRVDGPHFLGNIIHHLVLDPRDGCTLLAAASTGHLGPTLFRSSDLGRHWQEAKRPPAFPKADDPARARAVNHTFWLTPGHASQPGTWYAGTSPHGLFRSEDRGDTWTPVDGFNDHPSMREWMGGPQDGTPDGPKLHSIIVDPRDPAHLYVGMSSGGVHESTDAGRTWAPLIDGMEVVEGFDVANPAMHDPHCVRLCAADPDRLWQQNHCGIYRLDRPAATWIRAGRTMPRRIGDIGFGIAVHPRAPDTAWVVPMDGTTVWPRTAVGGRPAVYGTRNGGRTWRRFDEGFPESQAWWTVKRQAFTIDGSDPAGLYLGTSSGEIWASRDEGGRWRCIARHLPEIYALETGIPG
ncbi:MAG: WD40/YVTN/BNR-like repeat-containing protein [Gammaproteobacteria bacterium]